MNTQIFKSVRVFAPSDFRLIWRDGALMASMLFIMPLAGWAMRYVLPWLADLLSEWIALDAYYGLVVAGMFIAGQPVLIGFLIGVLFVEERDQGTLDVLRASPFSLPAFLLYRFAIGITLSLVLTIITVLLVGLISVSWPELLASAMLAALFVPVVVLVYAVFIKNKVQALMFVKPLQTWGGLPAFLVFAPMPVQWIGGLLMPMYFPIRFFWGASQGQPEWWLLIPGVVIPLSLLAWLWKRIN